MLLFAAAAFAAGLAARSRGHASSGFAVVAVSFVAQSAQFAAMRDQPGALAAVVAAMGCAWACGSAATARFRVRPNRNRQEA
jgi:membrane-associated PAP2 superfamily phosphatase